MKPVSRLIGVLWLALALGALLSVGGCATATEEKPATPAEETSTVEASDEPTVGAGGETLYVPEYRPTGEEIATIKTNKGEIVVQLFGEEAPIHVGNFVELSRKGFYEQTKFHRYEPGFVIQGGDPLTTEATSEEVEKGMGDFGTGGPGYNIRGEFDLLDNPNKHEKYALGMARSQSPDSAGSQFYFTLEASPFLDGQYTVFGQVTKGMDVVDELRVGDVIESVTISGAK